MERHAELRLPQFSRRKRWPYQVLSRMETLGQCWSRAKVQANKGKKELIPRRTAPYVDVHVPMIVTDGK